MLSPLFSLPFPAPTLSGGTPETYFTFPYSFCPGFPTAPSSINAGLALRPTPTCVLRSPRSVPCAPTHWHPLWLSSRTAESLCAVSPTASVPASSAHSPFLPAVCVKYLALVAPPLLTEGPDCPVPLLPERLPFLHISLFSFLRLRLSALTASLQVPPASSILPSLHGPSHGSLLRHSLSPAPPLPLVCRRPGLPSAVPASPRPPILAGRGRGRGPAP